MNAHTEPHFFELETFKDAQRYSDKLRPNPLATEIAQERVCADLWEYSDFLAGQINGERQWCPYFGDISVSELQKVQFSAVATKEQVWEATQELRRRYLHDKRDLVASYEEEAATA